MLLDDAPMDGSRWVGIASASTLVVTLFWQLRSQWKKGTSEGVSRYLFVGQLCASSGFAIYSVMIGDPVFVVTNVATGLAAVLGLWMTIAMRRRARSTRPWRRGGSARETAA